jgi:outer membrane protein TolC
MFFALTTTAEAQKQDSIIIPSVKEVIAQGLNANYDIKITKKTIDIYEGITKSYSGAFDPNIGFSTDYLSGVDPSVSFKDKFKMDLYYYQNTKPGINFSTGVNFMRLTDISGQGDLENINGLWFEMGIPLLRGLGPYNKTTVNLKISELKYNSTKINFEFEITYFIKNIILAYTRLYIDQQLINSYDTILSDLNKVLSDMEMEVNKNMIPKSELIIVNTSVKQVESKRQLALTQMNNSYLKLMKLMGQENVSGIIHKVKMPYLIPDFEPDKMKLYVIRKIANKENIIKNSLDFMNQENRKNIAEYELKSAKNEKLNDFQLKLKYNYYAMETNVDWSNSIVFGSGYYPGSSYGLTLNYLLPIGNNNKKGLYLSKLEEFNLERQQTEKLIFIKEKELQDVGNSLLGAIKLYEMQKEITELRWQVYKNELLKYNIGKSTQMDILTSNENYVRAIISLNEIQMSMIDLFINFKFLCNQIPRSSSELSQFSVFSY